MIYFSYTINKDKASVALYIAKNDMRYNSRLFIWLRDKKDNIEASLQRRIDWRDAKKPNLYVWIEDQGGLDTPRRWDSLQDEMIQVMSDFERILTPYLDRFLRES
jgi:hypothetical protein